MLLIPIEKLKNGRDSFRKAREAHLIHKVLVLMPPGGSGRRECQLLVSSRNALRDDTKNGRVADYRTHAIDRVNYICCSGVML